MLRMILALIRLLISSRTIMLPRHVRFMAKRVQKIWKAFLPQTQHCLPEENFLKSRRIYFLRR